MQMATILLIQTMHHIHLTTAHTIKMSTKDLIDFNVVTAEATTMVTTMMMVLSVDIDVATMTLEESIEDLIDRHKSHDFKEI